MTNTTQPHLFCFGFGYTASYLSQYLQQQDNSWKISGTTTSELKCDELTEHGITPYLFERSKPLTNLETLLQDVTHLSLIHI